MVALLLFSLSPLRADFVKITRGLIPLWANSLKQRPSKPNQPPVKKEAGFIPHHSSFPHSLIQYARLTNQLLSNPLITEPQWQTNP